MNRCLCGLATKHHFANGKKLDCWQAAARHRLATVRRMALGALLRALSRAVGAVSAMP
jgi:hypothetical protein